jgi:D-alanyl-D-alanine endopeptidase (penicillin-binding protein 7)
MLKSALAIAISVCVFGLAAPGASAGEPAAAPAKKRLHKKSAAKRKPVRRSAVPVMSTSLNSRDGAIRRTVAVVRANGKTNYRVSYAPSVPVAPVYTVGDLAGLNATRDPLALRSNAALVIDQTDSRILFEKNSGVPLPIASLTKLMTALVVLEARQDMNELLEVTADDIDRERNSTSRLRVGAQLTRQDMLHIALMSSENRAASALGRNYPGGLPGFVAAMNAKAKSLGMTDTRYVDSTGLSSHNMASARDLAKVVVAAYQHPTIRNYSTDQKYAVPVGRRPLQYVNSNRLVSSTSWDIGLQKTGYITEAGRCLVMQAKIDSRPVVMVFLDSKGKDSRLGDASRIRKWLEATKPHGIAPMAPIPPQQVNSPVVPQHVTSPAAPQQISYTAAKQS